MTTYLAQGGGVGGGVGNPLLNIGIFAGFVVITLGIVVYVGRTNRTASDYYAAGRSFTGPQNGVAIAGEIHESEVRVTPFNDRE